MREAGGGIGVRVVTPGVSGVLMLRNPLPVTMINATGIVAELRESVRCGKVDQAILDAVREALVIAVEEGVRVVPRRNAKPVEGDIIVLNVCGVRHGEGVKLAPGIAGGVRRPEVDKELIDEDVPEDEELRRVGGGALKEVGFKPGMCTAPEEGQSIADFAGVRIWPGKKRSPSAKNLLTTREESSEEQGVRAIEGLRVQPKLMITRISGVGGGEDVDDVGLEGRGCQPAVKKGLLPVCHGLLGGQDLCEEGRVPKRSSGQSSGGRRKWARRSGRRSWWRSTRGSERSSTWRSVRRLARVEGWCTGEMRKGRSWGTAGKRS